MCSDGPGSAPNEIPKGVPFLEREQEREEERTPGLGWRREGVPASISSRGLGPNRTRHPRTVRGAHVDGPRGAWTIRHPGADSPLFDLGPPVLPLSPPSRADSPRRPGRRSARSRRIVRPTAADSPTSFF
jgi:hypothetical protein